jgi:hypothetical protein
MLGSHESDARKAWDDLLEHRHPFAGDTRLVVQEAREIAARPRKVLDKSRADGIGDGDEDDWDGAGSALHSGDNVRCIRENYLGLLRKQLPCATLNLLRGRRAKSRVDANVSTRRPSQLLEPLEKRREAGFHCWIVFGQVG